ncbi:MAG: tetratricopeptide repeat protein [Polyangiales bacterium]
MLAFAPSARADSVRDLFERGNAAHARGDYAAAVREYQALVESGIDDPDVSFDLASSHGALGHYGEAIRWFQRSLRLAPGDDAAREGLKAARQALGERQAQARGEAIVVDRPPLTEALFAAFTSDGLAIALLVAVWVAAALFLLLSVLRAEALRLGAGIGAALALAIAVFSALGVGAKADWGRDGTRAVVLREGVPLREGPDDAARLTGELAEGETARIISRSGRFARVIVRNEQTGYARGEDVGEF